MLRSLVRNCTLLLFPLLFLPHCTDDQATDFAPLERSLVLSWISLERGDTLAARDFHSSAQSQWNLLRGRYTDYPTLPQERAALARMSLWMNRLRQSMAAEDPQQSLAFLSLLRNEMRALRPQYGLQHPADALYDFFYEWERFEEAVQDPKLCLLEWGELADQFDLARKAWGDYQYRSPQHPGDFFPGRGRYGNQIETAGQALNSALSDCADSMEVADREAVIAPAAAVRQQYFDYLALLLDAPGPLLR